MQICFPFLNFCGILCIASKTAFLLRRAAEQHNECGALKLVMFETIVDLNLIVVEFTHINLTRDWSCQIAIVNLN